MNKKSYPYDKFGLIGLILLLLLGVAFMLVVGQFAILILPDWSVNASMDSNLNPEGANNTNGQARPIFQPLSQDIIELPDWWNTFLESGVDVEIVIVPFWAATPNASPAPSVVPSPTASSTPVTPSVTPSPSGTPPATSTKPAESETCKDPAATNNGGDLPCVYPPTTCTDPAASNNGGALPCVFPPTTCTDPAASNNGGALPCLYPVASVPAGTQAGMPANVNVGVPSGSPVGGVSNGQYIVIRLSTNGSSTLQVVGPSDTNYDLAYYELYRPIDNNIHMDRVIISISIDNVVFYEVFNWGNGIADTNSNVGAVAGTEEDNQPISSSVLYGTNPTDTGILIDVDNAPSNPPPGFYDYIAIAAPVDPPLPASPNGDSGLDVDAIQVLPP